MAFIQDFKDWKTAKKSVKAIEVALSDVCKAVPSTCKAYPCFYNGDTKKSVKDITIYEMVCRDCTKFKTLLQLQKAQQEQQLLKQKLLDNFRFWKQK